jgi:hypothetical protein
LKAIGFESDNVLFQKSIGLGNADVDRDFGTIPFLGLLTRPYRDWDTQQVEGVAWSVSGVITLVDSSQFLEVLDVGVLRIECNGRVRLEGKRKAPAT